MAELPQFGRDGSGQEIAVQAQELQTGELSQFGRDGSGQVMLGHAYGRQCRQVQALQSGKLPQLERQGSPAHMILQPQLRHASLRIQGQGTTHPRFRVGRDLARGHAGKHRLAKPEIIQDGQDHLVVGGRGGAPLGGQREFTLGGATPTPNDRLRLRSKVLLERADLIAHPRPLGWGQVRQLLHMEARRGWLVVDPAVRLHPEADPAPGPARDLRKQEPRSRHHRDLAHDGHGRAIGRRQHEQCWRRDAGVPHRVRPAGCGHRHADVVVCPREPIGAGEAVRPLTECVLHGLGGGPLG